MFLSDTEDVRYDLISLAIFITKCLTPHAGQHFLANHLY